MTLRLLIVLAALTLFPLLLVGCSACSGDEDAAPEAPPSSAPTEEEGAADVKTPPKAADAQVNGDSKEATKGKDAQTKGKARGALDAKTKAQADRNTREADFKKRAARRREAVAAKEDEKAARKAVGQDKDKPEARGAVAAPKAPAPRSSALPQLTTKTTQAGSAPAPAPRAPALKPLNISRYLTITDARRLTGEATLTKGKPLVGIKATERYNTTYFAPQLRSKFGVSIQVWKEKIRRDANDRLKTMERDFPNAQETDALPPKAIFSNFGEIMSISFADLTRSLVVSVSCGESVCSPEELVALAKSVKSKL